MRILTLFLLLKNTLSFITKDNFIYDSYGRIKIFHGINQINKYKSDGYYFKSLLNKNNSIKLKSLGFNVVRLGWMWDGFEHYKNEYNMTYFNVMNDIVNNLGANGIYTILDMHQDGLSSKFCLYDGIPEWVVNKSVSKFKFPWPLKGNCSSRNWEANLLTESVSKAYQDLYDNKNNMLDDMGRFWLNSAKLWKNNKYVLGYEIINEPFVGNFYKNPLLLLPGISGNKNLMPFYNKISNSIRQVDNNTLIFYEPITWGMLFNQKYINNGFNSVPGGNSYKNKSVYSYHYYCGSFLQNVYKNKYRKLICDNFLEKNLFDSVTKFTKRVGGSSFLTEFGACPDNNISECNNILSNLDNKFISWTDYTYGQSNNLDFSNIWTNSYSRTYPQSISGYPINISYNEKSKEFTFYYNIDLTIKEPTEIYYTKLLNISISSNLNYKINHTNNVINLYGNNNGVGFIKIY